MLPNKLYLTRCRWSHRARCSALVMKFSVAVYGGTMELRPLANLDTEFALRVSVVETRELQGTHNNALKVIFCEFCFK